MGERQGVNTPACKVVSMHSPRSVQVVPVVMSGGSGTRLWPLSTEDSPKQFHALASELTMIQDTVLRVSGDEVVSFTPPILICNRRHKEIAAAQLTRLGLEPSMIVLEPFGRNTAAVAAMASQLSAELHPGALVLLLPADHVISDDFGFRTAISQALAAAQDHIVTFGITPTGPETGYGYIQSGTPLGDGVCEVARFAEKPDVATAEAYVADGGYHWNAGIFLFSPQVMLDEMRRFRPDIVEGALAALASAPRLGAMLHLEDAVFARCPAESIDFAVLEKTDRAAVLPCEVGWADVGSWSELWRLGPHDAERNVVRGDAVVMDSRGSLVWAEDRTVAVLGVDDLIVVASGDHVIVLPRARAQDVKKVVERLKAVRAASPELHPLPVTATAALAG